MNLSTFILVLVMIASFCQMVSEEPVIHPLLSVFFFVMALLWIGFQPRKPYTIHAYMNGMFRKMFFIFGVGLPGGISAWAYLYEVTVLTPYRIPESIFMAGFFIIEGVLISAMVYILYWSLPFSRKEKGIPAVDAAIARYKKPREEVAGAWLPDLVVDGKSYSVLTYHIQNRDTGMLGLDMQGKAVRGLDLMNKVITCARLAHAVANPEQINARAKSYTDTQKMLKLLDTGLSRFDRSAGVLGEKRAEQVRAVKQALQLIREYSIALCEMWYTEAEWGNQRGNAHLKEVRYEDVFELTSRMKAFPLVREKVDILLEGIQAARILLKAIQKEPAIHRQSPDLKPLMELIIGFDKTAQMTKDAKEKGVELVKYMGLSEEDKENWEKRLKWVEEVDRAV